ncbi:MAG: sulfite exporter TauE/SafE family protein [Phycisphaerales bacterium]
MDLPHILLAAAVGLGAGIVGGLAGIGGSIVIIPGLILVFGYRDEAHSEHHVYMAAAMCVNVLIGAVATRGHIAAGALRPALFRGLIPGMVVGITVGVGVSNILHGQLLKELLALFIAGYCLLNLFRAYRPRTDATRPPEHTGRGVLGGIGLVSGFSAGLLGLGGGVVMVPLLQVVANVRLRQAIAASAAVMIVSATVGAFLKLVTLSATSGHPASAALWYVPALAPGAMLGGALGAWLAHRLPLAVVRVAVSVLLLIAALRMSDVFAWVIDRF